MTGIRLIPCVSSGFALLCNTLAGLDSNSVFALNQLVIPGCVKGTLKDALDRVVQLCIYKKEWLKIWNCWKSRLTDAEFDAFAQIPAEDSQNGL